MLEYLRGGNMALNKGLKKYVDDLREKRIKEQDKKIKGLQRLKYDDGLRTHR